MLCSTTTIKLSQNLTYIVAGSKMPKTFDDFIKEVRDSCETHAKRKNYTDEDIDGRNQLVNVMQILGLSAPHGVGEIIYKCAEFLKTPRPLLMVKVAGWAWIIWRGLPEEKDAK